ncbi:MAG: PKD domain-containing protein [Pseudomonadota bacterium]
MKFKTTFSYFVGISTAFAVSPIFMSSEAWAMFMIDGTKEVSPGIYENPNDGMCVIGIDGSGNMLVDTSITNARDCVAYTTGLTGMTTQATCAPAAGGVGSDGYRHTWASSNTCIDAVDPSTAISLVDLDRTLAMCTSKGGTTLSPSSTAQGGTCVAYGWQYRNRKADGTVPAVANAPATTKGVISADNLGFCYATMRITLTGSNSTSTTCPSYNSDSTNPAWTLASNGQSYPSQEMYDEGLGWTWSNPNCNYAYGVKGYIHSGVSTAVSGVVRAAGSYQDLTQFTTQGDCIANGFSWDNWLPMSATTLITGITTNLGAANTEIRKFDALTLPKDGGGNFISGTGSVCNKCHTDQSRSYAERTKTGFINVGHKKTGDLAPWNDIGDEWGLKGMHCTVCHGTAKPAQEDIIQVNETTGLPENATGHNKTKYGATVTQICFYCHGTPATDPSNNPAAEIPVSGGEFSLTSKSVAPIANQFLNSPHANYTGDSSKLALLTKANYDSDFVGKICRTGNGTIGNGSIITTIYQDGEARIIPLTNSAINTDCTNAGDGSATSGAAGNWVNEGSSVANSQGNCMTCHDVHWSLDDSSPESEPIRRECTTCHSDPDSVASINFIDLDTSTRHPAGAGTPLENMNTSANEACEICHMPRKTADGSMIHIWRIYTEDADYRTINGDGIAQTDGSGKVWLDLATSCGQCHGAGGSAHKYSQSQILPFAQGLHTDGAKYPTDCTDCHTRTVAHPSGAKTPNDCMKCHGTTRPGVKPNVTKACLSCHGKGGVANHKFTAVQLAATAAAIHAGGEPPSCIECHATTQPQNLVNHPITTCETCHTKAGVAPTVASACNPCHGGSKGPGAVQSGVPFLNATILANAAPKIHKNVAPKAAMRLVAPDSNKTQAGIQLKITNAVKVTDISTDANGNLSTIRVNWGDGSSARLAPGGTKTHKFTTTGSKTITLTAIDSKGLKATKRRNVTVIK